MSNKHYDILFKQRKNKTFNYKTRFSKENKETSNLDEDSNTKDFISKWKVGSNTNRKMKGGMPVKTLILILVLLLICMYLLEGKYM